MVVVSTMPWLCHFLCLSCAFLLLKLRDQFVYLIWTENARFLRTSPLHYHLLMQFYLARSREKCTPVLSDTLLTPGTMAKWSGFPKAAGTEIRFIIKIHILRKERKW